MKIKIIAFIVFITITSCKKQLNNDGISQKKDVIEVLDNWHKAAAEANFDNYFSLMTSNGVFVGTDPSENWQNKAFRTFSKSYFNKGKAWSFKSIQRNVYFNDDHTIAWFDELLNTQMQICRGSGVLTKQNGKWKIAHYVLSITIPNENTTEVVKLKTKFDNLLKSNLVETK